MTLIADLTAALEDARGESSWCNDRDCSCHRVPAQIEEKIEALSVPCPDCGAAAGEECGADCLGTEGTTQ